ncbi:MAG: hypothetical protein QY318_02590 [Candidatus Dojkabacteria bacterium]|nr:MAG: hypothetical protein QY318_02590 [Candidatus Dojkabacteria bacterium]
MTPNNQTNNVSQQERELLIQQEIPRYLQRMLSVDQWERFTLEQKDLLRQSENGLPKNLNGIVPDSIWGTLQPEQKLEFLFSHNLLPRFEMTADPMEAVSHGFDGAMQGTETMSVEMAEEAESQAVEVPLQQESKEQFTQAVERMNQVEEQYSTDVEPQLPPEDVRHLDNERGRNLLLSSPTIVGHRPSDDLLANYKKYADGNTTQSKTWISTMIQKFVDSIGLERVE